MILYRTVEKQAEAEQIIEKSRFIAHVCPVSSREEAETFISGIKARYKDATHNVPAMVIGDKSQIQWASDDGEPQGTSGAPIVQMLVKEGITDVVIVVTRYFGGIKLGTGGLVRAYTGSAKLGLEAARVCSVKEMVCMSVKMDYTFLGKIQNLEKDGLFSIGDIKYEECVTADLVTETENAEKLKDLVKGATAGKGVITGEKNILAKC